MLEPEWQNAGVRIPSVPPQRPWEIYEVIAEDLDGNSYRVRDDTGTSKQKGKLPERVGPKSVLLLSLHSKIIGVASVSTVVRWK